MYASPVSTKRPDSHDILDLSALPPGQRRAVEALIGGQTARTYTQAAEMAGVHVGTLFRHLGRVRRRHPQVYRMIRMLRLAQLALRHKTALQSARTHTRAWLRKQRWRWWA